MRSRLLALAAAVAMVVVAVQVRARLDDRADEQHPRIVCATEVAVVCDALDGDADVTVEAAGVTADRLLGAAEGDDLGLDGWITPGPWAELVRQARERAQKVGGLTVGGPIARSRLAVAVWPGRLSCPEVTWQCVVQGSTAPAFKIGFPDARRHALGLVTLGSLARSLSPDNPLEDDAFRGALGALDRASLKPLPRLATVLAGGPSYADAYVTVEAGAGRRMTLAYPAPVVTAEVVPAHGRGERGRRAAELLEGGRVVDALRAAGWDTSPGAGGSGLPDTGTLEALRALWSEVAR